MSQETKEPDIAPRAAVPSFMGKRALWFAATGYLAPLLILLGMKSDATRFGGLIALFFVFPVIEAVALVMGLLSLREKGWQGRVGAVLALLGLGGWGWFFWSFLNTPLRLF
jgi:hypothetical protein